MENGNLFSMIQSALGFLVTGFVGMLVYEIKEGKNSVSELNVKIGIILERLINHEKEIEKHNERITLIERKKH